MRRTLTFLLASFFLGAPLAAAPRLAAGAISDSPFAGSVAAIILDEVMYLVGQNQAGDAGFAVYRRNPASGELALVRTYDHRARKCAKA